MALTFVVGALPRLMGGVILLLWSGTCSLQLAGNSGQGANLCGFGLKTLLHCHDPNYALQNGHRHVNLVKNIRSEDKTEETK